MLCNRGYFGNAPVGSVVGPGSDIFSLSLMAAPLYVLFEACIFIARIFERRKKAAANV